MANKKSLKDLVEDEVKDLYSAEKQLTKAIPKMAKGSEASRAQGGVYEPPGGDPEPGEPVEQVAQLLEIKPTGKKCMGMEGVIKEGAEAFEEDGVESVLNLGLIGAGSLVEHYEMAGYLTAVSLAKRMGASAVADLLSQLLAEEQNAEKTLRTIASNLLRTAPKEARGLLSAKTLWDAAAG